ncbi:hypothetical protein Taro_001128 [Colocasia esculenta]|uniref:Uncharacterized protein n=1 Tax=Colocasia esculenta TaxID=4460 RepID=A0A843TJR2_COLES|nr:hypothetical protein [Colocasia esculenta]
MVVVWARYANPFVLLVHCFETRRSQAMRFECVGLARRDSTNRLCDACHLDPMWHQLGWICLKKLNAASTLDAISIRVLSVSFRPDRAEAALSGEGDEMMRLLWRFLVDFDSSWLMRHGNHARMMLGAWACRRRGGFGEFFSVFFR